jgi:hypothetical protein
LNILLERLKENVSAVIPIAVIVLILNFTLVPLGFLTAIRFLVGAIFIIIGLSLFLVGVDIGITPLGSLTGSSLVKTNRLWLVLSVGFVLAFFISLAEPGLLVLANQVAFVTLKQITSFELLAVVSVGLAILVALGFVRIFKSIPLYRWLMACYIIVFFLGLFTTPEFLAIAFDASGATTGILAVPFILALSVGVAALRKDSKASEKDSFGLVAIASVGAILSVEVLSILSGTQEYATASLEPVRIASPSIFGPFVTLVPDAVWESFVSILPLLVALIALQRFLFKLARKPYYRMLKGFAYAFVGLFMFLVGVNGGFMEVGSEIGYRLAKMDNKLPLLVTGFALGFFTIVAEPAVFVLTHTIEEVTAGYVKRKAVGLALSIGVGIAVALAIIRILVPTIKLWHYLLPGYIVALSMMFFVPKLFVGIAFDAGGVATGPMTATFILAFTQGAAGAFEGANVLSDGFGMIALVAMTPIITLQTLGLIFQARSKKEGVEASSAS